MPTLARALTGAALAVISGPMFLLNVSVLYVLVSERFFSKRYSSFYVLSTVNIIGDSIKTALVTFYLAPASITESWLFPGGPASPFSKILAVFELLVWYQEIILEVFMALDRLVTVVFPDYSWIFSRKTIVVIACGIFPLATALTLIADFVMPCCTLYIYYGTYASNYFGDGFNYANTIFDVPMNFSSSAIAISCYAIIIVYVIRTNRLLASSVDDRTKRKRRNQEIRFTIQFGLLSLFILFVWVSLRIFPLFVPPNMTELYALNTIANVLHCSANSFLCVSMNPEFRSKYKRLFVRCQNPGMYGSTSSVVFVSHTDATQ